MYMYILVMVMRKWEQMLLHQQVREYRWLRRAGVGHHWPSLKKRAKMAEIYLLFGMASGAAP